ncbi:MAG: NAD(P)/FAD-dependent oxidoreductase [Dermatophilaceae bacterium]|nr:FAD-dependent oxidoreductase [Intrasporangiaceae bacterium]
MTTATPMRGVWDLVVVGGGAAGIVAAKTAARLGAATLLVERDRTGGDCLWRGCVPSKALLAAASAAAQARDAGRFGIDVRGVDVDFPRVMKHIRETIAHIEPVDSIETLESEGVTVLTGEATFVGGDRIRVGEQEIRFEQAVVAAGASPAVPPISGLPGADFLTSDTIWDLTDLPEDLVILGGGSIGCELGQAFARLGTRVSIVEGAPRIMPREDAQAAALVAAALRRDGVSIHAGAGVSRVEPGAGTSGRLVLDDGREVPYGRLVVAVGRAPQTRGLGLESAGVTVDQRGFVTVDDRLRTTNPRIWAAGDLTGHPQFTHLAGQHGSLAASNAVLGLRRRVALTAVPRVTFTHPEVAAVGVTTDPLPAGLRIVQWHNDLVDRAAADADTDGLTRLAVDRKGRVLGAVVVGPRAGESLAELTLAIKQGLRTRDLAAAIHPYPTYGDGPWNAALSDIRGTLSRPPAKHGVAVLRRVRRWRLDRAG